MLPGSEIADVTCAAKLVKRQPQRAAKLTAIARVEEAAARRRQRARHKLRRGRVVVKEIVCLQAKAMFDGFHASSASQPHVDVERLGEISADHHAAVCC